MARYTGPSCKICRREGAKLFLKGRRCFEKCPIDKKGALPPGEASRRRKKGKTSDYAKRLREKQKVKRLYGVLEQQFRRYFKEASKSNNVGLKLLQLLETRLDNTVWRLGFSLSKKEARQLVSHGHILVDGKKVDVSSFNVKKDQVISLKPSSLEFPFVKEALEKIKPKEVPLWLERKGPVGKVVRMPKQEDLKENIDEQLVIEYYAR